MGPQSRSKSRRSGFPGLRHLLGWLEGSRGVGMSRQFIAMGMGMGIMPGRKGWFGLGVVGRVGMRMIHGVVPVLLSMAFLVLAGL